MRGSFFSFFFNSIMVTFLLPSWTNVSINIMLRDKNYPAGLQRPLMELQRMLQLLIG